MSNDINSKNINPEATPGRNQYSESKGTGVLSTLIFAIAVVIFMIILAYFKGS